MKEEFFNWLKEEYGLDETSWNRNKYSFTNGPGKAYYEEFLSELREEEDANDDEQPVIQPDKLTGKEKATIFFTILGGFGTHKMLRGAESKLLKGSRIGLIGLLGLAVVHIVGVAYGAKASRSFFSDALDFSSMKESEK